MKERIKRWLNAIDLFLGDVVWGNPEDIKARDEALRIASEAGVRERLF